ncbi:hypothetical protein LTR27_005577 [Elasticomyces elasticus]|nr:hypothetical protein LTR27_005577 [Elasticomyces elasticus]
MLEQTEDYWQASSELLFSTWYYDSDRFTTETVTVTQFGTEPSVTTVTNMQYAGTIPIKTDVFKKSGDDVVLETLHISLENLHLGHLLRLQHRGVLYENLRTTSTAKGNTEVYFVIGESIVASLYETTDYTAITAGLGVTTPPCVLPSSVPQCQCQWDNWVDTQVYGWGTPDCNQASMTGDLCADPVGNDAYVAESTGV